jgi:fibronectin-binding autotransporter adhesin
LSRLLENRRARLFSSVAALAILAQFAIPGCAFADTVSVTDQAGFAGAVVDAIAGSEAVTIRASGAGTFVAGSDWLLPGNASSVSIVFDASSLVIGNADGDSIVTLGTGSELTLNGTSEGNAGRIEIGDGGTGTLTIAGGSVTLSDSSYLSVGSGTGRVNLDGGTLTVGGADGIRGTGAFNLGGGTLSLGSDLTSSTAMILTSGSTSYITTNDHDAALAGTISGSGSLVKLSGGTLTLWGDNSYSGGTVLSYGTIGLGSSTALGTGLVSITGDATLALGDGIEVANDLVVSSTAVSLDVDQGEATVSGDISGSGGIAKTGAGTLTLSGTGSYGGDTQIAAGRLVAGSAGALSAETTVTVDAGATLELTADQTVAGLAGSGDINTNTYDFTLDGSDDSAFGGVISNSGNRWDSAYGTFTKSGSGTLTLEGATIQGGEASIQGGQIAIEAYTSTVDYLAVGTGSGNSGTLAISGGTLNVGVALNVGDGGGTGTVEQTGGVVNVSPTCDDTANCASLTIGNEGGTGTYTISAGALNLHGGLHNLGRSSGANAASTGTLDISGSGAVVVGSASGVGGKLILGNATAGATNNGTGTINQTGGTLTISAGSQLFLSAYGNGRYDLLGGTLQVGGTDGLAARYAGSGTSKLNLGGGTIQVTGSALTTSVNATLVTGSTSTIDTNGFDATWSGNILGSGALTKTGSGTLILVKSNTYGGGTTISGGTVEISLLNGMGTGGVTFDGGTLATTATFAAARTAALTGAGTLKPSDSTTLTWSGVISGNGGLTKSGGGTLVLSGTNTYKGGTTIAAGTLSFSSDANLGDSAGGITLSGGSLTTGTSSWTSSRDITIDSGSTLTTNASTTLSGSISGTGGLTKTGISSLTLSGDMSSYTGAVTLSAGSLRINTTSFSSDVANSTNLSFISDSDISYAGTVSGTGTLTKSGTGTLTLTGNNTNTGTTSVTAGILQISADTNLGSGSLSLNRGTLATTASFSAARAVTLSTGGTFIPSAATTLTLSGVVSGSGRLTKSGEGTLILSGTNTYTGNTTISAGILQVAANANLGGAGSLTFSGGTLATTATFDSARAVTLSGAGTFAPATDTTLTLSGVVSGSGSLTKAGAGTLILSGTNTYEGDTTIAAGTLQIGSDANLGNSDNVVIFSGGALATTQSLTSSRRYDFAEDGVFNVATGTTLTLNGTLEGDGALVVSGAGTLVIDQETTYWGGTVLAGGTLVVGDHMNLGEDSGRLTFEGGTLQAAQSFETGRGVTLSADGTIITDPSTTLTLSGSISGDGGLTKSGSGTLILSASNSYTGTTTVAEGILDLSGSLDGSADVEDGATLTGSGRVDGTVTVRDGGTLAGAQGSALTMGGLTLDSGANLDVTLGEASAGGVFTVEGDLTLDGTLTVTQAPGFGAGVYTIVTYGGDLTDNGLEVATLDGDFLTGVQTAQAGEINLVVQGGDAAIQFWNGSTTSQAGTVTGGDGTWSAGSTENWTDASGTIPQTWGDGFAVFQGAAGTVAIDDDDGDVTVTGMQFVTSGYVLSGDSITLIGDEPATIRVGDGTEAGAATVATIDSVLAGTAGLEKTDHGTLVLSGENTYSGGTTISGGTLQVSSDANLGDQSGDVAIDDGTLAATASFTSSRSVTITGAARLSAANGTTLTLAGAISGTGGLTKIGAGTLVLSGENSFEGATTVSAGTLALNGGSSLADDAGLTIAADATVSLGDADETVGSLAGAGSLALGTHSLTAGGDDSSSTYSGAVSGTGDLVKAGTGTLTLTGASSLAGTLDVSGGAVDLAGSVAGDADVADGATLRGSGSVAGTVTVQDGGTLVGVQGSGLTLGGLSLAAGATVDVTLGAATDGGVFTVNGDVTLDGTLDVTGTTGFGVGVYSFISYTGTLTDNGMTVASLGTGTFGGVQTSIAGEVNLVVEDANVPILFWNGTTTNSAQTVEGGDGTWTSGSSSNWSNASGTVAQAWNGGFAVFQGEAGTVTVDDASGDVGVTGLQFVTSGYVVTGDTITLTGDGPATIRVGDGTEAGAATVATIDSVIAGTAGLEKTDHGTLVLSGENTYSGGTTISGGTLQVSADGNLGDQSGGVSLDGGTLAATASFTSGRSVTVTGAAAFYTAADATLTLAGDISGTGGLTKTGDGTLILTADTIYAGTTTISEGTLQIGDGGTTGSISGDIVNNANLVFNRSDSYTIAGNITGSGTLTLSGGGTAQFSASYSGEVKLAGATVELVAETTTTADFVIGDGGVLGGSATIGSLTANAGGTVAPGYSPGTLTVDGPVTFNAGSTYAVDVTPDGSHDRIVASGDVTLSSDATVDVVASGGTYDRQSTYTILTTAGTVTGTFGSVTSNLAFLRPTLTYDAQNVYLGLVHTGSDFADYARTANQRQVAAAAQALGDGDALYEEILLLAEEAVAPAFDQLAGDVYASVNTVIQQSSVHLRDAVGARIRQAGVDASSPTAQGSGSAMAALDRQGTSVLWAQGYGAWSDVSGNGNAASLSAAVGGLVAGLDGAMTDFVRAGVLAGYGRTVFDADGRSSAGSMNSFDLGVYAGGQFGALGLRGGASYTLHDVDVERTVAFSDVSERQSAGYTTGTTQLFGEAGYRVGVAGSEFEPFASLAYVDLSGVSTREGGSGIAGLAIDVDGQETVYTTLGTRLATSFDLGGGTLTPSVTVGWQHASGDTTPSATMRFLSGSTPFDIQGVPIAQSTLVVGAGFVYGLSDRLSLQVDYAGQIAADASQNAFNARFSQRF